MNRRQIFVPLTDEVLYEHPEWIAARGELMPFSATVPCYRWLAEQGAEGSTVEDAAVPPVRLKLTPRQRGSLLPPKRLPMVPAYGT